MRAMARAIWPRRWTVNRSEVLSAAQPPESPEQWERWWLQVVRRAIVVDYLVHHGRPGPPEGDQGTNADARTGRPCPLRRVRHNAQPTSSRSATTS